MMLYNEKEKAIVMYILRNCRVCMPLHTTKLFRNGLDTFFKGPGLHSYAFFILGTTQERAASFQIKLNTIN